nr:hypothetical protein [Tanacetum cinerariifolium]
KKDLSWTGLPEFVDDTVTDYSRPSPTIESTSEEGQNKNSSTSEGVASLITPKPFVKFVKPKECQSESKTNKKETPKKPPGKYAEMYRRPSKKPTVRGNQQNKNNLKTQQLGPEFAMKRKACYNYGDFSHLANDCRKRVQRETTRPHGPPMRPMRSNMNGARPKRTSALRPQYRAPWVPTVNRNFPPVNRKLPTSNSNVSTVCCCCSRHVNTARPKAVINRRNRVKDVQASACWVWKPVKPNSASIILKRYDYIDLRGRSRVENLEQDKIAQALEITKLKQRVKSLEKKNKLKEDASKQREIIANIDADEDVTLKDVAIVAKEVEVEKDADVQGRLEESQAKVYHIDLEHADKVLSRQDDEPELAELQEVIEVVTTTKLMTEVVTAANTTITVVAPITAAKITTAPSAARKRKGVVIRDPEETATLSTIIHTESKSKDKGKGALKRKTESSDEKAVKKQKLDKEVEELKKHLQIVPNDDDDVYTEATPLALKIVQERFASSKPKNFSDDFLLTTLTYMFEKPDVEAQVWKNQRGVHDDLAGREKISIDKVHFQADAEQCKLMLLKTSRICSKGLLQLVEDLLLEQIDAVR